MSTDFKPTPRFMLTQFSGGPSFGICMQVTNRHSDQLAIDHKTNHAFLVMTKQDAAELGEALTQWSLGLRDED